MTPAPRDFTQAVHEALGHVLHATDCAVAGVTIAEFGPCDCDREQRIAKRVAEAIEEAVREFAASAEDPQNSEPTWQDASLAILRGARPA